MAGYVEGVDRTQATLFPDRLDDFVDADNPVRVVDAFVDALDLGELGGDEDRQYRTTHGVNQGRLSPICPATVDGTGRAAQQAPNVRPGKPMGAKTKGNRLALRLSTPQSEPAPLSTQPRPKAE